MTIDTSECTAPLKNIVEPLFRTLGAFCPYEDFQRMLTEPQHYSRKPEKVFENAVSWLFSLAGYSVINLAPSIHQKSFEVLTAPESGCQIGSADILAYEENKALLLIDCDIGVSYDSKIRLLLKGKEYLEKNNQVEVSIIPVLCTPNEVPNLVDNGVVIMGKHTLENIFVEVAKGNREGAKSKVHEAISRVGAALT